MMRKHFGLTAVRWPLGNLVWLALMCFVVVTVRDAAADDDDVVNSKGFEMNPPYGFNPGILEGQVNPPGEGQVFPPGAWLRTQGGTSTAVVQNTVFHPAGGTQAVQVVRAPGSDDRWAVPVNHLGYPDYPNPFPPEEVQPCMCISWDMLVTPTIGPPDTFGPFFGVEAYDDDSVPVGLLGSLGVDATTGEVLYQAAGTGFLTPTGSEVDFNDWNHFQIKLDYSTYQYSVFLNYAMIGTIGFVDSGLSRFTDADIATLAAAGDPASLALTGTGYFDNFLVREGACPIPEPSSLALAALCLIAGCVRSRRSR